MALSLMKVTRKEKQKGVVRKVPKLKKPVGRKVLRTSFVLELVKTAQAQRGNKFDNKLGFCQKKANDISLKQRAGYPLDTTKVKVKPEDWKTKDGKVVLVDMARVAWLPDDWGQGVKMTNPVWKSIPGRGGTLTTFCSPAGNYYYHKFRVEQEVGRKLTHADGFRGQLRAAKLQGKQTDENVFFKLLNKDEFKCLPKAEEIRFCVVSARRTQTEEGLTDIARVQALFEVAGVVPTWYVDAESLQDYKKLGLVCKVGGKLTPARNMCLKDAEAEGKACCQCSDDITSWNYHDGPMAKNRTDDAVNAAFAAATCHTLSPVAAARFMLAKLRGSKDMTPKLAGVFPLGSCARGFGGPPEKHRNFILGDFFVADRSPVRFDENMNLKEDYDFTCQHIKRHGSVLRLERMTVQAKHQTNAGGACSERDKKGVAEQRNISILQEKWPGVFHMNWKRPNEVLMRWKKDSDEKEEDDAVGAESEGGSKKLNKRVATRRASLKKPGKHVIKAPKFKGLPPTARIVAGTKVPSSACIQKRCKSVCGKRVGAVVGKIKYVKTNGKSATYGVSDLKYDIMMGVLCLQ
eukprot:TRINITY_DN69482_c0_g1_i1.p1 TRINITY_DN69482_c0_g1~~TRINITY_DN69482_c0_g1_i1.p1  ORF type:complete len:575 (+),score=102.89 TRINITY_DN69482_c0_g1_i1:85-1809(+)